MRLEKIKLAGFKSFVDPTTVPLPSNLVGVVGPNGCGKSNIIDAVRWVMGESSAKMLRGESMADVIFNGSSARKPVGTATIELVFDNSDGKAGGKYAQYNQISVKRQVSRDGQSNYYLNGVRCRRRDITDLFLGTGLGPRSYAIIEQGMISRLIEARPEDLRVFLEEAAGISKYKERRKETENRIAHTRDNLDRLNDLREELSKQLERLKRQAAAAEKYKELRAEERRVKAELMALRWHALDEDKQRRDRKIAELDNTLEAALAEQRRIESQIEKDRELHVEATERFGTVQENFYGVGGEIARLEQAIQYAEDTRRQLERDLREVEQACAEAESDKGEDHSRLEEMRNTLTTQEPLLVAARAAEQAAAAQLEKAERAMQAWQTEWDEFNQHAAKPAQTAQVERTRINHLEQQEQNLRQRIERLGAELTRLHDPALEAEIERLSMEESEWQRQLDQHQTHLEEVRTRIATTREQNRQRVAALNDLRAELQTAKGREASLEALQQASLGREAGETAEWLARHHLAGAARLAEKLKVDERWQRAVEVVLGYRLQGVVVEDIDALADAGTLKNGTLTLFDQGQGDAAAPAADALLSKIESPVTLEDVLGDVRLARDVSDALRRRHSLAHHESLVTPEGVWIGRNWMRLAGEDDETAGVLARARELDALKERIAELGRQEAALAAELEHGRVALKEAEQALEQEQRELNEINRKRADIRADLAGKRTRQEHIRNRTESLKKEREELERQIGAGVEEMEAVRTRLHAALEEIDTLAVRRETLVATRDRLRDELEQAREAFSRERALAHQYALEVESMRAARSSLEQSLGRMATQLEQLTRRRDELRRALEEGKPSLAEQKDTLEKKLAERVSVEKNLAEARADLEEVDNRLRQLEQERHQAEQKVGEGRNRLDQARLQRQEILIRAKTFEEQLREAGYEAAALFESLPSDADESEWQAQVEKLAARIQRLGAINLAAIDEYREQSERKEYLDAQHADISESLETLENAIRKIDRETRTRFKETYDKVNAGLQEKFPQLFGGGHAYLQLTGEDLLDTGVAVMARPPGKRNSSIHLLSGGEKALTAVALVFSIFELNPAPFCMLDEVDAPLDDANVGRFCDLVRSMSDRVQFIFITHNKVTMEIANQLTGVTMHEPGVSRLVAVDVEKAARLAAV